MTALDLLGTGVGTAQEEFNVKDFGAKGDGVSVDTDAFQDAMNAAGGGGTVYVPPGEYLVVQVRVREQTTVYGEGRDSKVLHAPWNLDDAPNTEIFSVNRVDDVTIRDLWFSGNLRAHTYTRQPGDGNSDLLDLTGGQRLAVERCDFTEPLKADVIDCDLTDESYNYSIVDNHIDMTVHDTAQEGIQMRGHDHLIQNN